MVEEKRFIMSKSDHCCSAMENALVSQRIPIEYCAIFREYYIPFRTTPNVGQTIFYCPWCGTMLPQSLRPEYYDILKNEYNVEPTLTIFENNEIPDLFKSDEWWKKAPGVPYIFKDIGERIPYYIQWNYIYGYVDGYEPRGRHIGGIDPQLKEYCAPPIYGQNMFP